MAQTQKTTTEQTTQKPKRVPVDSGFVAGVYISVWDNHNDEGKRWRSLQTSVRDGKGGFENTLWFASQVYAADFEQRLLELYGERQVRELMLVVNNSDRLAEALQWDTAKSSGWL